MAKSFSSNPKRFLKDWCAKTYKFLTEACAALELSNLSCHKALSEMSLPELIDWSEELHRRLVVVIEHCTMLVRHNSPNYEQYLPYIDKAVHYSNIRVNGRV